VCTRGAGRRALYLLTNWSSSGGEKHYTNWIKRAKTGQTPPRLADFLKNGGRLGKKVNISPLLKRTLECFFLNYDYYYYYYYYCFWIPPLISLQSNPPPPSKRFTHLAQCIIWGGEQKGMLHSISHCRRVTFPFSALQHSLPNEEKMYKLLLSCLRKGRR